MNKLAGYEVNKAAKELFEKIGTFTNDVRYLYLIDNKEILHDRNIKGSVGFDRDIRPFLVPTYSQEHLHRVLREFLSLYIDVTWLGEKTWHFEVIAISEIGSNLMNDFKIAKGTENSYESALEKALLITYIQLYKID